MTQIMLSHGRVVREYNVSMDIHGSYTKLDRNNRLIDLASYMYTGTKTTVNVINHHAARNCTGAEVVSHSKYSVFFGEHRYLHYCSKAAHTYAQP